MPSIFEQLEEASYKNIPFLVNSTNTTGGRKTFTHEFVNSPRRDVEDLGKLDKVFKIEAILDNSDGRYFFKKSDLIRVLEEPGSGILTHPFFGSIEVVPKPYTVSERFSDLGAAVFSLTFERVQIPETITPILFTLAKINNLQIQSLDLLGTDIEENFEVNRSFPFNFVAAENLLRSVTDQIESVFETFDKALSAIDGFAATLNDFRNSIRRLIQAPGQLKTGLINLFNDAVALTEVPEEAVLTLERLFDFGDDEPEIIQTTAERIEKAANQDLLKIFIQAGALSFAYSQAAAIDFFTIREIDTFANKLNTQYNKVFPLITQPETAQGLQELRDVTNEFLDIQRLNAKKIVPFTTQSKPVSVLAYQLYGSIDDSDRLANLNVVKDLGFIDGSIEVFR